MNDTLDENPVTVNGKIIDVPDSIGLPELLRRVEIDPEHARGIAVAINGEVIPKRLWSDHTIAAGDRIEIVTAKQGG